MATKTTRDWLDLYDMMLDRGLEFAKDPHAGALKRGITQAELDAQGGQMPAKMSMDAYYAMRNSWKRVRTSMQIFGLELGDDLEIEPGIILETSTPAFKQWMCNPWVEISRGAEKPLRFDGRDAITAVGFLNMYIQQMETLDPRKRIREALEAQGITKDNFHEKVGADSGIRDPWDDLDATTPAVKG